MKKALFYLIFLIFIAGVVLFFGWIRIPENNYGIFFSSITGYEKKVFEPGNFYWRWQKLIPKNSQLYLIPGAVQKTALNIKGKLPAGDVYSVVMPGNPDFSYSASVNISYSFNKDYLIDSVTKKGSDFISNTEIESFFNDTNKKLENIISLRIDTEFLNNIENSQNNTNIGETVFADNELREFISKTINEIEIIDTNIITFSFPDINLYKTATEQYKVIAADKRKTILESEARSAIIATNLEKGLEALQKYGELLTKNPLLLEYFKLNPDADILSDILKENKKE